MKSPGNIFRIFALCLVGFSFVPFSGMGQTLPGIHYYWPADGDALDPIGGNNGHLFGGATFGPGIIGQAFDLTGSGDRVYMDQPFPAMNIGDDYTVSLWMMMTSAPVDFGTLMTTRSDDPKGFSLGVNPDGGPWIAGTCDDSPGYFYCYGSATPLDEWKHVAAVFNWTANVIEIYVNGDPASTCDLTECDGLTYSDKIYLGASFDDFPGWEFTGFLDEIQIYDRALDGTEIQWLYEHSVSAVPNGGATTVMELYDASPNPFNPLTTISFELPGDQAVSLRVYDVAGRLVETLLNDEIGQSGRNEIVWHGRDEAGRVMPAGVYFYRLEAGTYVETKRMTLLK